MDEFQNMIKNTRDKNAIVHFITNYVTVNDCANMTLAIGGSPIMADSIDEMEDIVQLCSALVINIGTLNKRTIASMIAAGKLANKLHRPVILDPAGVGASKLRNDTVKLLMREINFAVIKGNISEIKFLFKGIASTQGVDASETDLVMEHNLQQAVICGKKLSRIAGSTIVITGPIDIIANKKESYVIRNGHPLMNKVTGTGCMISGLIGSCVAGNTHDVLKATTVAVGAMGICGELAYQRMVEMNVGTNTYRSLMIDYMGKMDDVTLSKYINMEHIIKEN